MRLSKIGLFKWYVYVIVLGVPQDLSQMFGMGLLNTEGRLIQNKVSGENIRAVLPCTND